MKYIVDIDGTICSQEKNQDGSIDYNKSQPYYDRIKRINALYDQGHEIHYWTARGSASGIDRYDLTLEQLKKWGVKYHRFYIGKPVYDVWIDDKAVNSEVFFDDQSSSQRNI